MSSTKRKSHLLGMSYGKATHRLRKAILWYLVKETKKDTCFRCEKGIESIEELSIEHKESWQLADNPQELFFDIDNITFSHLKCNVGSYKRSIKVCPQGHVYDTKTTVIFEGMRYCRCCKNERDRKRYNTDEYRANHNEYRARKRKRASEC